MSRTVVVTGGTRGIGAGVSEVLAAAGYKVIAATASQEEIEQFAGSKEIDRQLVDVTDNSAVTEFFARLDSLHGLVNCAGILRRHDEYEIEVFEQVINVNLTGHNALLLGCTTLIGGIRWFDCQHRINAQHFWRAVGACLFSFKRRCRAAHQSAVR